MSSREGLQTDEECAFSPSCRHAAPTCTLYLHPLIPRMKKHLATIIIVIVLIALVYLQFRTWKSFDWVKFREQTENINLLRILLAIACVYSVYVLRAIRWRI